MTDVVIEDLLARATKFETEIKFITDDDEDVESRENEDIAKAVPLKSFSFS